MEFVALDFETANADMSSICQIGLACYKNGLLAGRMEDIHRPRRLL